MRDSSVLVGHLLRLLDGPIVSALRRDDVTDVHVNPDGVVRVQSYTGTEVVEGGVEAQALRAAFHLVATDVGQSLVNGVAFLSARLPSAPPFNGSRLEAVLQPVSEGPCCAIRIHAPKVFSLESFFESASGVGATAAGSCDVGSSVVEDEEGVQRMVEQLLQSSRPNLLIVGGTGSGKTSFLNSVLQLVAKHFPADRLVCLEDVPEIRVTSSDRLCLRTEGTAYALEDLLRHTLRLNPRRIVVGEVRGPEALHLIDAWSTGHDGGIGTVHADDAQGALVRLNRLAKRGAVSDAASFELEIAAAVDLVIVLKREYGVPRVVSIDRVVSSLSSDGEFQLERVAVGPTGGL